MALASQPKPSAFAELLRRSKFASYDPAIRQAYKAPPANAHRGDWGLKRPIALRRKNAFISLTSFEHHAHFAEWNHAENQVRFIRRVEEMGGRISSQQSSSWYKTTGGRSSASASAFDSDFASEQDCFSGMETMVEGAELVDVDAESVDINSLGKRGPGSYSSKRPLPTPKEMSKEVFVSENVDAMSKREFRRYLRSLRAQRQEFQEFINAEDQIPEKNLYSLAKNPFGVEYRRFLQGQMQRGYQNYGEQRIEPQPHPTAGLSYRNPTMLESYLWTSTKPGFLFTTQPNQKEEKYVTTFGGITATINQKDLTNKSVLLDVNSQEGVKLDEVDNSILQLRLESKHGLVIEAPPVTVGKRPQGLKGVKVRAVVTTDSGRMNWENQHEHGSQEYVAQEPVGRKSQLQSFNKLRATSPAFDRSNPQLIDMMKRMMLTKSEKL
ncbi:hypothetical protein H0H92_002987 [Tricholoma furcatifolium]|nr:hypothetical protein H0H92_002987 [Tricholoma furcatifolium]